MRRLEEPSEETPNKREGNYLRFPWQLLVSLAEKLPKADVSSAVGASSDWLVILERDGAERRTQIRVAAGDKPAWFKEFESSEELEGRFPGTGQLDLVAPQGG